MRKQLLRPLFFLVITLLCAGSLLIALILSNTFDDNHVERHKSSFAKKAVLRSADLCNNCSNVERHKSSFAKKGVLRSADLCKNCSNKEPHKPEKTNAPEPRELCTNCSKEKPRSLSPETKRFPQSAAACTNCSKVDPPKPPPEKKSSPQSTDLCKNCSKVDPPKSPPEKKSSPQSTDLCKNCSAVKPHKEAPEKQRPPQSAPQLCKGCKAIMDKVRQCCSGTWKKQEDNYQKIRSQLNAKCQGFDKFIMTQANTAVGSNIVYNGEQKRTLNVTPEIFNTFAKEHPFPNKTWGTCAVVGNGGILTNSSCGKMIDSADFVIRCNLPPLENEYGKHVGIKTDLVTVNPSILMQKYGALIGRRRQFVDSLKKYGNSLLLLPAFSFAYNTAVSLRALYTLEDFGGPTQPVIFNPEYLLNLDTFWHSQGMRAPRLSTGITMASLALELCSNVHLYGFWPFGNHPQGFHALTNHYYDDAQVKTSFHRMPDEFERLLQLHSQGVLRLQLGDCDASEK